MRSEATVGHGCQNSLRMCQGTSAGLMLPRKSAVAASGPVAADRERRAEYSTPADLTLSQTVYGFNRRP